MKGLIHSCLYGTFLCSNFSSLQTRTLSQESHNKSVWDLDVCWFCCCLRTFTSEGLNPVLNICKTLLRWYKNICTWRCLIRHAQYPASYQSHNPAAALRHSHGTFTQLQQGVWTHMAPVPASYKRWIHLWRCAMVLQLQQRAHICGPAS